MDTAERNRLNGITIDTETSPLPSVDAGLFWALIGVTSTLEHFLALTGHQKDPATVVTLRNAKAAIDRSRGLPVVAA